MTMESATESVKMSIFPQSLIVLTPLYISRGLNSAEA